MLPLPAYSEEPKWELQKKFGSAGRHQRTMGGDQDDNKLAT
jgi:hypothetical protein